MSLVRIKNITMGKLVFLAVRDFSGEPLTLEAGEEKDVFPSMVSQPSIQRVIGTKVVIVYASVAAAVAKVEKSVTPVVEALPAPEVKEIVTAAVEEPSETVASSTIELPKEAPAIKTRKGRR